VLSQHSRYLYPVLETTFKWAPKKFTVLGCTPSCGKVFRVCKGNNTVHPNTRGSRTSSVLVAALHAGVRTVWPISCLPANDLSTGSWFNYEDARDRTGRERQKITENTVKIMAWETKAQECDGWNQRSRRCAVPFTNKTLCSAMDVGYKWHFGNEEDKCNIGLLHSWTLHIV
jgi:hypothetical protein